MSLWQYFPLISVDNSSQNSLTRKKNYIDQYKIKYMQFFFFILTNTVLKGEMHVIFQIKLFFSPLYHSENSPFDFETHLAIMHF